MYLDNSGSADTITDLRYMPDGEVVFVGYTTGATNALLGILSKLGVKTHLKELGDGANPNFFLEMALSSTSAYAVGSLYDGTQQAAGIVKFSTSDLSVTSAEMFGTTGAFTEIFGNVIYHSFNGTDSIFATGVTTAGAFGLAGATSFLMEINPSTLAKVNIYYYYNLQTREITGV